MLSKEGFFEQRVNSAFICLRTARDRNKAELMAKANSFH